MTTSRLQRLVRGITLAEQAGASAVASDVGQRLDGTHHLDEAGSQPGREIGALAVGSVANRYALAASSTVEVESNQLKALRVVRTALP